MEQTIKINPVELATQLAASRIDELYQSNEIPFPYVDDNEDTDVTCYTEEGQKHFDDWYDWYYTVVTGHDKYKKSSTYLVINMATKTFSRWHGDGNLFFAGSIDDALIGLDDTYQAIPVKDCPKDIQDEYEKRIDECILNGEISI
jgi:hypothetical protein